MARLAKATALAGGAVLLAVVAMTCTSIAGRAAIALGGAPVPGDFELVEIGVGFAVFAFLPWCTYARGHARVDILAPALGRVGNAAANVVAEALMTAAAALIAWRLWLGTLDKRAYGETTFVLNAPLWVAYAACLGAACVFVAVAAFCLVRALREVGRPDVPGDVAG